MGTHEVFVSYANQDRFVADAACAMFEGNGIRCWIAPRDVNPGVNYGESILDAIEGARVMVLIYSGHANKSPQVEREVERAVSKGLLLVPFRIEDVPLRRSLEFFISSSHWLDALDGPLEPHLLRLTAAVQHLLLPLQNTEIRSSAVNPPEEQRSAVLRYAARSDRGLVSANNQDSVYAGARLLAIADGEWQFGEVASQLVVASLAHLDDETSDDPLAALRDGMRDADRKIDDFVRSDTQLRGMGTTATAMHFSGSAVALAHIGNSRAYLLRDGRLSQLTADDGRLLRGDGANVRLDTHEWRIDDRFLLCSKGVSRLDMETLKATLQQFTVVAEAADRLIELSLRAGGEHNISVILAEAIDWQG